LTILVTVPLREVVEPITTWDPVKSGNGATFTYIDLSAVDQSAKRVLGARPVDCHDAPSRARQIVAKDDVLVATVRPNLNAVALVPEELDQAIASTGFCVLRPSQGRLDSRYLYHWVRAPQFVSAMVKQATGASYPAVSDKIVKASVVPLPPLTEQRRIADILDKADSLRANRRATLAQFGGFAQSAFLEIFGNAATILDHWPIAKLGDLLDFLTSGSRGWAAHYAESGDLFLRIQNVRRDELVLDDVAFVRAPNTAEAKRTRVEAGDVLLSITADLGRSAVVPEGIGPAFINQHLSILRTRALHPRFLSAFLTSPAGQRQIAQSDNVGVKSGLNFDDVRNLRVPNPPRTLQERFVSVVEVADARKSAYLRSLGHMDALFATLQHRAFRGEL